MTLKAAMERVRDLADRAIEYDFAKIEAEDGLAIKRVLAALEAGQWRPIADETPKTGTVVLVWCGWSMAAHLDEAGKWRCAETGNRIFHVTHWMPSPLPPASEG